MATVLNVADAIVQTLSAATLSQPITVERLYVPNYRIEDVSDLKVTVVPREVTVASLDRRRDWQEVAIDIAVQKKFDEGDAAEIDPLVALVEEIAELFKHSRLDSFPAAMWVKTQHVVLYSTEHWEQYRQFTSLLTVSFRVTR